MTEINSAINPAGILATSTFRSLGMENKFTRSRNTSVSVENSHVFIVDDEEIVVDVLRAHLEEAGYRRFTTCTDSTKAINLLQKTSPDIVITDLLMPGINGFSLLRAIRSDRRFSKLPVLMLTSKTDKKTRIQALELGATDFLSKPVDATELALRLRNSLLAKSYQDAMDLAFKESDELLHSILPAPVIERLKGGESIIADRFESVTVLFADLVSFTEFAGNTDPFVVVMLLNQVFGAFDEVVENYGLEKIKTIGDAYLLAGGLSDDEKEYASTVVRASFAMRDALEAAMKQTGFDLKMRVGIHTGPVTAGIIGHSKVFYDVWGDTVNVASRIESIAMGGMTCISETTRDLLDANIQTSPAKTVDIKGKGKMNVYQVLSCN